MQITDATGIANGSAVNYTVSAHNSAYGALANWNSASGTGFPAGPPLYVSGNAPTAVATGTSGTAATLSWPGGGVHVERCHDHRLPGGRVPRRDPRAELFYVVGQ